MPYSDYDYSNCINEDFKPTPEEVERLEALGVDKAIIARLADSAFLGSGATYKNYPKNLGFYIRLTWCSAFYYHSYRLKSEDARRLFEGRYNLRIDMRVFEEVVKHFRFTERDMRIYQIERKRFSMVGDKMFPTIYHFAIYGAIWSILWSRNKCFKIIEKEPEITNEYLEYILLQDCKWFDKHPDADIISGVYQHHDIDQCFNQTTYKPYIFPQKTDPAPLYAKCGARTLECDYEGIATPVIVPDSKCRSELLEFANFFSSGRGTFALQSRGAVLHHGDNPSEYANFVSFCEGRREDSINSEDYELPENVPFDIPLDYDALRFNYDKEI